MTDPLIAQAEKHLAADHARDDKLDRAQRFAEVLAAADDDAWDRGHDQWSDREAGIW